MKSKKEIKEWLLENCVNEYGDLDLSNLDFSDSKMNVHTYGMNVNGHLIQGNQKVKGTLFQESQTVTDDLFQDRQKTKGNLYQGFQKVKHDLYQYKQKVKGNIYQDKLKAKMTAEETLEQKLVEAQIENAELKEENEAWRVFLSKLVELQKSVGCNSGAELCEYVKGLQEENEKQKKILDVLKSGYMWLDDIGCQECIRALIVKDDSEEDYEIIKRFIENE